MADEEKQEQEELVIETPEEEAPEKQAVAESEPEKASGDEELDSYSKGVQSRIKKLTEKYRQEERDKAEALRVSQQLLEENKKQVKEVPQELAKVEEVKVELEEVSEIVHSPENEVEKKQVNFSKSVVNMTPQERIYAMLNNK